MPKYLYNEKEQEEIEIDDDEDDDGGKNKYVNIEKANQRKHKTQGPKFNYKNNNKWGEIVIAKQQQSKKSNRNSKGLKQPPTQQQMQVYDQPSVYECVCKKGLTVSSYN